jgi:hypothetical protein
VIEEVHPAQQQEGGRQFEAEEALVLFLVAPDVAEREREGNALVGAGRGQLVAACAAGVELLDLTVGGAAVAVDDVAVVAVLLAERKQEAVPTDLDAGAAG